MTQPSPNINRRMAKGALWMIGLRFADQFVGFVSTVILARLLIPADFGLVTLAMAIVAAIGIFGEFGFDLALIQNQKAGRRYYDTAWTLGILRGFIASALILLASGPIASAYGDPRLTDILLFVAILPVLEGFINIGTVNFRKDLALGREFAFHFCARVAGTATTITLAFMWRDYWALIAGILTTGAIRLLSSYLMHSYRPRLSLVVWREIMIFSKWILLTSIFAFINRRSDTFIIGKLLDVSTLGLFSIATEISNMASTHLVAPIKRALFPGFAKLAHDIGLLKQSFIDTYGLLVLVACPVAVGIGVTADLFVPLLLGDKWTGAVPLMQVLVFSGVLISIRGHVRPLYLAMNRPKLGAYVSIGQAIVFLPLLSLGLWKYGAIGAAWAHVVTQALMVVTQYIIARKLLRIVANDLLKVCWRSFIACLLVALSASLVKDHYGIDTAGSLQQVGLLSLTVLTGALVYIGSVLLLWHLSGRPVQSPEAHVMNVLSSTLRNRISRFKLMSSSGSQ